MTTSGYWAEFPVTYRAEQIATLMQWARTGEIAAARPIAIFTSVGAILALSPSTTCLIRPVMKMWSRLMHARSSVCTHLTASAVAALARDRVNAHLNPAAG